MYILSNITHIIFAANIAFLVYFTGLSASYVYILYIDIIVTHYSTICNIVSIVLILYHACYRSILYIPVNCN